ncbi:MAG TPA: nucleotidyltransferase family protein [Pyrinomonadaceae bacterium]|nr:nucleotidyltransferase family protein [Pyrinomonadaceae bacterium]
MKSCKSCSAILLAAGRSSRMGAFKPLLPFGNKTVIEYCIDSLREAGVETVVVAVGHRADDLRDKLTGVTFALNPDPDSEMGASIAAGVRKLPDDAQATLIALADHPAVPATVVSTIIEEWTQGARIVIPTWEGRGGHPVLVDLSFRPELLNLPASGGLRAFFESHRDAIRRIPVNSPFVARDMDTWDDYRALHLEATGKPAPEPPQN